MRKKLFFLLPQILAFLTLAYQTTDAFPRSETAKEAGIVKVRVTPSTKDQIEMLKRFEPYHLSEMPAMQPNRSYDYELPKDEISLLEAVMIPFETLAGDTNYWTDEYYYSYQEVYDILSSIYATYPEIASMESLGLSTRDSVTIWGIKISDNPEQQEDEPDVLIDAVTHAREPVNANVCMALIDSLISGYGNNPMITNLVDETEIWVIPIKNVEGYLYVETGITDPWWRKNKRDNNGNGTFDGVVWEWCRGEFPSHVDGVDLNRNYAEGWNNAGSPDSCSIVYRGPSSFSENESQMERNLVEGEHIVASICFHSYSEYVGYCGQDPAGVDLCQEVAASIIREDGVTPYDCDTFYGSGQSYNWMYWEYGVQGYLIETATEFMPSGHDRIDSIVENNVNGIFTMLNRVHGTSIIGHVYDSETLEPLVAEVSIEGEYPINGPRSSEPDYGRFYRMVRGPDVYVLHVRKQGYEDYMDPTVIVQEGSPTYVEVPLVKSTIDIEERDPAGFINVDTFSISQNQPNPFNPSTTLRYAIPQGEGPVNVSIAIYDVRGRLVRSLVDDREDAGVHQVHWDGKDEQGEPVPSGIYLYRIDAGGFHSTHKMALTR